MKLPLLATLLLSLCACNCTPLKSVTRGPEPKEVEAVMSEIPMASSPEEIAVPVIRFTGEVSEESAAALINVLAVVEAAGAKTIILELNTPGGSTDAGFMISKAIEDAQVPVVCVVDGEADSMGFYILQSCDTRIMTKRSVLMAHFSYFSRASGSLDIPRLKELLAILVVSNEAAVEHECRRLSIPMETCRAKIAGSWWMSWKEAATVKAVDGVVDSVSAVVESYRKDLKPPAFAKP